MINNTMISHLARYSAWWLSLFVVQILLFFVFGTFALIKIVMTPDVMEAAGIFWAKQAPLWFVRFVGFCELVGSFGIILPSLTRICPSLTPLIAVGFAMVQVLAVSFDAVRGEIATRGPIHLLLLGLSLFVLWGRTTKMPIVPASARKPRLP